MLSQYEMACYSKYRLQTCTYMCAAHDPSRNAYMAGSARLVVVVAEARAVCPCS